MLEEYLSEKQKKKRTRKRRLWWSLAGVLFFGIVLFAVWIVG
jgi:hypothetical protein